MSVFEQSAEDINLDHLVGEGKKYKDPDELAKAYAHASTFIDRLKEENDGLRTELSAGLTVKDVLERHLDARPQSAPPAQESPPPAQPAPVQVAEPAISKEDLTALVRQVNEEDTRVRTAQENATKVEQTLIDIYGSPEKANQAVRARADELGVSLKFLEGVALQSPKAFLAQMGLDAPKQQSAPQATRSDVNTEAFRRGSTAVKPGTYAWYNELRRTNPNEYWSPKIQNALYSDRTRLGESFYEGS
jgi:hypothetical protein